MRTTTTKVLKFEGAGMEGTGAPVGNCRIRTRIKNKDGRIIYLEMNGHEVGKHSAAYFKQFRVGGCVQHCFYEDLEEDKRKNYSKELQPVERTYFEYNKDKILKIVNEMLGCDFDEVVVDNNAYVFDESEPILSDCQTV